MLIDLQDSKTTRYITCPSVICTHTPKKVRVDDTIKLYGNYFPVKEVIKEAKSSYHSGNNYYEIRI